MEFLGRYKEFNKSSNYESITNYFSEERYEGQDKIAQYLRSGKEDIISMEIPKDVITGERIPGEKVGMNDGVYTWFNILAYYVEKYNLRLPKEFEDYVLEKSKE